jgi:hypothetical protein
MLGLTLDKMVNFAEERRQFVKDLVYKNLPQFAGKPLLKPLSRIAHFHYGRKVKNDAKVDSPCESFKGWSLIELIASINFSLLSTEKEVYRRQVVTYD